MVQNVQNGNNHYVEQCYHASNIITHNMQLKTAHIILMNGATLPQTVAMFPCLVWRGSSVEARFEEIRYSIYRVMGLHSWQMPNVAILSCHQADSTTMKAFSNI